MKCRNFRPLRKNKCDLKIEIQSFLETKKTLWEKEKMLFSKHYFLQVNRSGDCMVQTQTIFVKPACGVQDIVVTMSLGYIYVPGFVQTMTSKEIAHLLSLASSRAF